MPEPLLYLKATGAAAIVSAIFVLTMASLRRPASAPWLQGVSALGISLGLALGYYVLALRVTWPPASGLDRLLTIVIPAVVAVELLGGVQRIPQWLVWLGRISLAALIPRVLLHGSVYLGGTDDAWSVWEAGTVLAACGLLLAGVWGLLAWLAQRGPGATISAALCLATLCAGLTVMMAGYIKGGAAALPLVATVAATTGVIWMIGKRSDVTVTLGPQAILGIGIVGLFGLLFIGHFFGRLSTGRALTILIAPLLCWITETPILRHRRPWLVTTLRLALVAIPLFIVLALAKRDFDRDMAPLLGSMDQRRNAPAEPAGTAAMALTLARQRLLTEAE